MLFVYEKHELVVFLYKRILFIATGIGDFTNEMTGILITIQVKTLERFLTATKVTLIDCLTLNNTRDSCRNVHILQEVVRG